MKSLKTVHRIFEFCWKMQLKYSNWLDREHIHFQWALFSICFVMGAIPIASTSFNLLSCLIPIIIYAFIIYLFTWSKSYQILTLLREARYSVMKYIKLGVYLTFFTTFYSVISLCLLSLKVPSINSIPNNYDNFLSSNLGKIFTGFGDYQMFIIIICVILFLVWLILSNFVNPSVAILTNTLFTALLGFTHTIVDYILSFFHNNFPFTSLSPDEIEYLMKHFTGGISPKAFLQMVLNTLYVPLFVAGGITALFCAMRKYYIEKYHTDELTSNPSNTSKQ